MIWEFPTQGESGCSFPNQPEGHGLLLSFPRPHGDDVCGTCVLCLCLSSHSSPPPQTEEGGGGGDHWGRGGHDYKSSWAEGRGCVIWTCSLMLAPSIATMNRGCGVPSVSYGLCSTAPAGRMRLHLDLSAYAIESYIFGLGFIWEYGDSSSVGCCSFFFGLGENKY